MTETISHQTIEDAFKAPARVIAELPDSVEAREAKRTLEVSENLTHLAREKHPRESAP